MIDSFGMKVKLKLKFPFILVNFYKQIFNCLDKTIKTNTINLATKYRNKLNYVEPKSSPYIMQAFLSY